MDNININVDSKAVRKLIDTVASGVGAVAGHWFTEGRAKANAESLRITAQAQKDAEDIAAGRKRLNTEGNLVTVQEVIEGQVTEATQDAGIEARITYQEHKRQDNLIKIVYNAAAEMPEHVSSEDVDPDWISRFFTYAQDISTEEMQKIWAKILADEVEKPGSTSPRTLECLKNITKEEAQIFEKIRPFVFHDFILKAICQPKEKYGISFEDLLALQQAGLIDPNWTLQKTLLTISDKDFKCVMWIGKNKFLEIKKEGQPNAKKKLNVIVMTRAGIELLNSIGKVDLNESYVEEFKQLFSDFEIAEIIEAKAKKVS